MIVIDNQGGNPLGNRVALQIPESEVFVVDLRFNTAIGQAITGPHFQGPPNCEVLSQHIVSAPEMGVSRAIYLMQATTPGESQMVWPFANFQVSLNVVSAFANQPMSPVPQYMF